MLFHDRAEAGEKLAELLREIPMVNPLVLAIPRGGVVTGAAIARKLGAELDVIVARKLQSPWNSELAIGAVVEGGKIYLNSIGEQIKKENPKYLEEEIKKQTQEIRERISKLRATKSKADPAQRTVILTDDGIATGATFFVALEFLRTQHPSLLIAAVPVLPKEQVKGLRKRCDKAIYLDVPSNFEAVGQFYENFWTVEFDEVLELLKTCETQLKESHHFKILEQVRKV